MALTDTEKQIVDSLKEQGYSNTDIINHIGATRAGRMSAIDRSVLETSQQKQDSLLEDITSTASSTFEGLKQRVTDIQEAAQVPATNVLQAQQEGKGVGGQILAGGAGLTEQAFVTGANVVGGAFDVISAPFFAAGKGLLSGEQEQAVADTATAAFEKTGIPEAIGNLDERGQRNARALISSLDLIGLGLAGKTARGVSKIFRPKVNPTTFVDDLAERVTSNITKQVEATGPLSARQAQNLAEANLTIKEKLIGLQPDVKKRLSEFGEEGVGEYLNATRLRNVSDSPIPGSEALLPEGVWGPQELGNYYVQQAVDTMDTLIKETGGEIGAVRNKLGTVPLPNQAVTNIEKAFLDELDKLNLEIRNGVISQKPGKVSRVSGTADINTMQELYTELVTFKAAPSFENAIDLRMVFDSKVKFGKRAAEVSNDVDPLSRAVRSQIAEDTAKFIGSENADALKRYSDFMDAYGDLKSYTDRAAGSEYLLRLALSGRGREARQVIDTINQYTDIDLMNHATAMKVAVDALGNANQQNLFRQEIAKAGADVAALSSGNLSGVLGVVARRAVELGVDPEDVIRGAARGGLKSSDVLERKSALQSLADQKGAINPRRPELKRQGVSLDKYNRLKGDALDAMEEYVDFIRTDDIIDIEDIRRIRANAELIADELGLEKGAGLADDFEGILQDKGRVSFNQSATTETTDLLEEARKYDSAEEFVKAQGTPVYHGTNSVAAGQIDTGGFKLPEISRQGDALGKGIYLTNNKSAAESFANRRDSGSPYRGRTFDVYIDPAAKIKSAESEAVFRNDPDVLDTNGNFSAEKLTKKYKELGFDGIEVERFDGTKEIVVFDPKMVRTTKQLEELWKKSQQR